VTYVRMTRPLKPDEGGTNGRLTRIHSGELVQLAETLRRSLRSRSNGNPRGRIRHLGVQTTLGVQPTRRSFRHAIWEAIPGHGGAHK
jgi:hypothetical protein